eukprot:gb/GECG01013222.1/.p1 GENE.gb/GECG01013222.1/~~gb/GECG01013222.1/.p1  ORF type:complete len:228 (+),score=19.35 gb/GECG01013222.1/:1-684(+)
MLHRIASISGRRAVGAASFRYPSIQSYANVGRRTMAISSEIGDIFTPTEEHKSLREMVRQFAEGEVQPQALEYNEREEFNFPLFKKLGDLGLLGITVSEEYGGSGMDATAVTIAHEELSAVDPAFCLSYLAHSLLFANNLYQNGNDEQCKRFLPGACTGELIGGMCMSEPASGTDVLAMKTNAKKGDDGSYTLTGQKNVDYEWLGQRYRLRRCFPCVRKNCRRERSW